MPSCSRKAKEMSRCVTNLLDEYLTYVLLSGSKQAPRCTLRCVPRRGGRSSSWEGRRARGNSGWLLAGQGRSGDRPGFRPGWGRFPLRSRLGASVHWLRHFHKATAHFGVAMWRSGEKSLSNGTCSRYSFPLWKFTTLRIHWRVRSNPITARAFKWYRTPRSEGWSIISA
jgi:hypothetical protein